MDVEFDVKRCYEVVMKLVDEAGNVSVVLFSVEETEIRPIKVANL